MKDLKFEKLMEKLENIVKKMEGGELELTESLNNFKEGMGIVKECQKRIEEGKKQVDMLIETKEGASFESFSKEDSDDG